MRKNLLPKTLFIIAVLLIFVYGILLGTDPEKAIDAWKQGGALAAFQQNIHLGLDLKGGTHLILQVAVDEAVNAETDRVLQQLKDDLTKAGISGEPAKPNPQNQPETIALNNVPTDKVSALRNLVSDNYPQYDLRSGPNNSYQLVMKPSELTSLKKRAVMQAIETIRNRVDQFGVSEPTIQEHGLGDYQILVELPGIDDEARVKELIQSTAMLDIRQALGGPYPDEQSALQANSGSIPPDAVLLSANTGEPGNNQQEYYLVARTAAVSGNDVRDAQPSRDENGRPDVQFSLTNDGGRRFAAFTGAHVKDKLAIVLDNRVRQVATIEEQIHDQVRLSGGFTEDQTKDISMMLRSGALPASIHYLDEETVGPSLGADSIRQGVMAAVVGMTAVLAFMLIYYRGAGINADLALLLNLVILLGFLGFSHATLTLPGIAGVILTIGMGVDSNVLIFERIREELRAGKAPAAAVEQGFGHAWLTIVDTHVTTIVSAFILFIFGTGPVRGFATTLTFGLLANLFTAVFVSRVIFDAGLNRKERGEALSI